MKHTVARFIPTVLFAWMFTCNAFGQDKTIDGTVMATDRPAAFSTVLLKPLNKSVTTDSSGHFSFQNLDSGKYSLIVSFTGHKKNQLDVLLKDSIQQVTITLSKKEDLMDEVVLSGTMRPVSKMSSPIPVEVYTPAYFKKNPSPNIFESLHMVNGVQPQLNCNVCNTGDIHINGMEGPYTMILIDGMPIVSSLSTVYGLSGIPNSMVKRIEVVKGPASTLYGSEAVGGLINIITKDAASTDRLRVDVSATGIGEINADITAKFKLKNATSILGVNYFNYQQKRDINHDNFTDVTLQERISVFNKWNFSAFGKPDASLAVRYIHENRWGGELQWAPRFKGTDSIYGETITTNRVEVISTTSIGSGIKADLSYNYHLQDSYYGAVKYYASQQVLFAQLRRTVSFGKHDVLIGIPFRYTFYDDNTPGTAKRNGQNQPTHTVLPGIFVQDEFRSSKQFTVLAGLRYDYHNEHGSILTPRLSFKYAPNNQHTFRLSGGNGYRVVNLFTEDHAALTGAREVVIASALQPEKSWNGNFNYTGIIRHSKGFVGIDGSVFYTYFTNKIVGDFITDPTKIIYDNLNGYAISKGITLNTDVNFTNGVKLMMGATYMKVYQVDKLSGGREQTIPQLFAPTISGTFSASYTLAKAGLTMDLTGRVNGPMYLPVVPNDFRPEQSPLYSIMNIQLTKNFKSGIEIYGGVKNFLNFIPDNPLLHPDDPFNKPGGKYFDSNGQALPSTNPYNYTFDPSYNFAAIQGAKLFIGLRWQIK